MYKSSSSKVLVVTYIFTFIQVEGQDGSLRFDFQTLQPYLCPPDTQLVFSREAIGSGCYGAVYKVNFNGRVCIGKKLYNVLKYASDETPSHCYKNFVRECILMSRAHHPNVVAFIGVHYGQDQYDLTLLMEKLHCDLGYYLEHTPNIPLCTKVSLLHDVSCGLLYLHEECSIIHRDLSAANILLTKENQAKIADLGVSKIIGIDVQKMTNAPGAQAYMSPEALQGKPYDKSLDIFSFGVVTLYVAIQKFPPFSHDNVPDLVILKGEGEVYKRQEWISKMEQNQPELTFLTVWCLKDGPQLRPSTVCLNILLEEMRDECL